MTRRYFFFGTLLGAVLPRRGLGYRSPNGKLNIAAIGAGGRGALDILGCSTENIVALADPDSERAARMFRKFYKAAKYQDFRRMLDKEDKNIDAVIVATPDFMHGTAAMWAMSRGKHVYCEKPLTRTVWEARQLTQAAEKYHVATQMGNQGYSTQGTRRAVELIESGAIGKVTEVHAWTNRPTWPQGMKALPAPARIPSSLDWQSWLGLAPDRPYSPVYVPFNWRGWLDFGCGALGDMGCHILGPANLALQLGAPSSVECVYRDGQSDVAFPTKSVIRFEFPGVKIFWYDGVAGTPPPAIAIQQSEALRQVFGTAPRAASKKPSNGSLFVGEKGFLTTGAYGEGTRLLNTAKLKTDKFRPANREHGPEHYQNWIEAAKGGARANSDFRVSGPFTEWVLLGVLAQRVAGPLSWDSASMRITNAPDAEQFLRPEMREGWQFG